MEVRAILSVKLIEAFVNLADTSETDLMGELVGKFYNIACSTSNHALRRWFKTQKKLEPLTEQKKEGQSLHSTLSNISYICELYQSLSEKMVNPLISVELREEAAVDFFTFATENLFLFLEDKGVFKICLQ